MKIVKKNSMGNFCKVFLISAFASLTVTNVYAEEGAIRFSNNAFKQVVSKAADGSVQYDYVEPGMVLPDDVILYEVVFENISNQDVSNIVVNNPLPNNSSYRAASAIGDSTVITYSVDGKNFAPADALKLRDENGITRQAKAEDYVAIRWLYKKTLSPGEKSKVTYKTVIKRPENQ